MGGGSTGGWMMDRRMDEWVVDGQTDGQMDG